MQAGHWVGVSDYAVWGTHSIRQPSVCPETPSDSLPKESQALYLFQQLASDQALRYSKSAVD